MPTKITLADGVTDGARQLTELALRDFTLGDILVMAFFDFSKLSDALKFISRPSGASIDDLCLMTQDDTLIALNAFSEHVEMFTRKAGF